jgi:TonB-dependent receptor
MASPISTFLRTCLLTAAAFQALPTLQAATIEGRVLDILTDSFLEGAQVRVLETGYEVVTGRGGNFRIANLDPGSYTLQARFIGFPSQLQVVDIAADGAVEQIVLGMGDPEVVQLDAFVVSAGLLGQAKAQSIQRYSDNLRNILSSDGFGEFVDRNAAEAMQRVVGVAVEDSQGEGRFVLIRGADRNLSTVAIDGVQVATPEEGGRSTGLNLIAIEQLESIDITKTWLPNQPANFIGGAVNLVTRSALDRDGRFGSIGFGYGSYDLSGEWSYKGNAVYGDVIGNDRFRFGYQLSFNQSLDRRASETLRGGSWNARVTSALRFSPDGFRLNTLYLDDYTIERERTGLSTRLEFQFNNKHTLRLAASYNQFNDDEVRQTVRQNPANSDQNYYGARTLTEANALALGYDLTDPAVAARVYAASAQQRRMTFEEGLQLGDVAYDFDRRAFTYSIWRGSSYREWQSSVADEEITTLQLSGDHLLSEQLKLEYKVHYSDASKDDHRQFVRLNADSDNNSIIILDGNKSMMLDQQDIVNDPERFRITESSGFIEDNFVFSEDQRYGADAAVEYTWETDSMRMRINAGLYYDAREKSFRRDFNRFSQMRLGGLNRIRLSAPMFYGGERAGFLEPINVAGEYDFGPMFATESTRAFINDPASAGVEFEQVRNDITYGVSDALLRDYDATEDIAAAFAMFSLDWRKFRLIAGLRFEHTANDFTNNDILTRGDELPVPFAQPGFWPLLIERVGIDAFIQPITSSRSYDHPLWALHLIHRPTDQLSFRYSVTTTIARPDFNDLVPREIVSVSGAFYGNSVNLPNFDLRPLEATNFDISVDYQFEKFGHVSVAVFYKDLDGPIYTENQVVESGELALYLTDKYNSNPAVADTRWSTNRRINAGAAELYGVEVSYEQQFLQLPGWLSGLGMAANFALMESSVRLPDDDTLRANEELPLFRQPDQLANLSVYWERGGFLARASMVYRGEYTDDAATTGGSIEELDAAGLPYDSFDVIFAESTRLDLLLRYRMRNGLQFTLEGTNLTDEPVESFRGERWRLHRIRYTGPVYFASIRYAF